jgi:hypothetical protein
MITESGGMSLILLGRDFCGRRTAPAVDSVGRARYFQRDDLAARAHPTAGTE